MIEYGLFRLNNGLRVFVIKKPGFMSVDLTLYVKTGSAFENKSNNGISHLLEHLLFYNRKNKNLRPFGLEINAFTRKDFTYYEAVAPKKYLAEMVRSFRKVVLEPKFEAEVLKKIKNIVKEEIDEKQDDPIEILNNQIEKHLYAGTAMAFPVFGSKNNINNLGINDLKEWYQENYQPENMIFTVAGDVSIKQASSCIEKYFQIKNIGKVRKFNDLTGFNFQKKEQETIINKKRFQRDYLAIVYPVGERLGLNLVKYSLLWDLIYQKLRFEIESSSLFYDADFAYFYDLFKGDFQDTFSCNKKNTAKIKKIFSQKIESMDFSEEFFQKTKDYFVSSLETKEDSPGDLSSLSLYLLNQPEKIIKLEDEVKKIKATSFAEIKKLKSGIFNESNRYIYLMQ